MARYFLSPAAAADIEGIASFLDEHAPHATDSVIDELQAAMTRLASHPGIGHLRTDLADEALRFYSVWSYVVIYREADGVEIVRVIHAARDVASELDSEA